MSNPPAPSTFDQRVGTVTSLLAAHICTNRALSLATNGELHNILTETLWEAGQNIFQPPVLHVPWSERLSTFRDIYRAGVRARQALFHKLIFIWFGIVIDLPVYLLFNIVQVRRAAMWSLKLVVRWARCLRDHHRQSGALLVTIRDSAKQQLPGMTDKEAEWMVVRIALLAIVAALLGLVHDT